MKTFITLLFMMSSLLATAQEKTAAAESKKITGVITDSEGMPIPGVNITIEGTKESVQTDFDGNYTINAKEGEKLIASYVGMFDETIPINKQTTINFKLKEDPNIVWNGSCYGAKYKIIISTDKHAIKSVTALWEEKRLNEQYIIPLQAKKPAISIGCTPDLSKTVVVRCSGAINGTPEPLYVIDRVPLNADNFKALNPADIISIDMLKDTGATSIYGNRGMGGVIIVKTKNGLTKKERRKLKREQKKLGKEQKTVTN